MITIAAAIVIAVLISILPKNPLILLYLIESTMTPSVKVLSTKISFTIVLYSDITKIRKRSEKKGNMQFNKQQNSV